MKRHQRISLVVAGLVLAAGFFLWWQPSRTILGTLAGEAFLDGFPTSYWAKQLTGGPAAQADAIAKLEQSGEKGISVLRELLRTNPLPEVRGTALEILGKLGPAAHTASEDAIQATKDQDSHVRAVAAKTIPQIETPAAEAVPVLIPLLDSEHAAVVARALSVYRGDARAALPTLVAIAQDETKSVEARWNAVRTLGKLGPDGLDALPVLIDFTKHPEDNIREHAAEAIGDIGPTAKDGIPALVDCLDDPFVKVRRDAVRSLGYIGAAARESIPQIKPLLDDPEEIVRVAAKKALQTIAPEEFPVENVDAEAPSSDKPITKPQKTGPSA